MKQKLIQILFVKINKFINFIITLFKNNLLINIDKKYSE